MPGRPGVVLNQLLPQDGTLVLGAPGGYYFTGESFLTALPPWLVLPGCSLRVGTAGGGHPDGVPYKCHLQWHWQPRATALRVAVGAPSVLVLPDTMSPRARVLGGAGQDPQALPRHLPAVAGEPRAPHGAGVWGLRGRVPG